MGRRPATVIEYRSYELPSHFPMRIIAGEDWRISDVPCGVLHFHNCLEIGLCESDGGKIDFAGHVEDFHAGDVTVIAGDVPHTTWSDAGTASKWAYLFCDPEELLRPFFALDTLPNARLLDGLLHGWCRVLSPQPSACPQQHRQPDRQHGHCTGPAVHQQPLYGELYHRRFGRGLQHEPITLSAGVP